MSRKGFSITTTNSVETLSFILMFKEKTQVDLTRDECCFIANSIIFLISFMPGEVISTSLKFNGVRKA